MKKQIIVDLESNGLLQEVSKVHCISCVDLNSSWSKLYLNTPTTNNIDEFLKLIDDPEVELIGHNIFYYDLKVLEKLYGWKPHKTQKIHDTIILSQLLFPDLKNNDADGCDDYPGKIFSKRDTGSHSLRAWGQRIHCYKGDYDGGWDEYNDEMGAYCIKDTYSTKSLFQFLTTQIPNKLLSEQPIEIEYALAPILARQQAHGVLFNQEKANELMSTLTARLVDLEWDLRELFPPRYVSLGEFTPKRNDNKKGYVSGKTFTKVIIQEFNPNSRAQIVSRLQQKYNWNPEEFTDKGNAKLDEEIIDNLPFEELKPLKEYLQSKLLLAKLQTGKKAWMTCVKEDGRVHGSVMQNGAVTGRMTHYSPNFNVPTEKKLYGKECRELFTTPKGKVMVGCDADSLEMRVIAGYLKPYDGGKMIKAVLEGKKEDGTDPHTINMMAYGLDNRDCAKTQFYGDVYGSKNAKKGKILLDYGVDLEQYVPDFDKQVKSMVKWVTQKNKEEQENGKEPLERSQTYWECWIAGKHLTQIFGDKMPELPKFKEKLAELVTERGYLKGLDGRKLWCRAVHGQLNTLCQAAGAIIMKKAQVICDTKLQEAGLTPGKDYEFVLTIHDEWEFEVTNDEKIVDKVKEIAENSIYEAGIFFKFPCEMRGNSKVGKNWAEVH